MLGSELAWSSDEIFQLKKLPKSILIVGGGYIACEFAFIFHHLGLNVTQLIRSNKILNGFDSDLSSALEETILSSGINLLKKDELVSIKKKKEDLTLILKSGLKLEKEKVLIAAGREPNFKYLNLNSIDLQMNGNYIEVDKNNKTNIPNIYAIGDVIDKPNLTPVAIEQGRVFSDNIFGGLRRLVSYDFIPKAVFTNPEISTIGLSEEKAISLYSEENIKIFKCKFTPMSNTFKRNKSKCMLKLIVKKSDDKVVGCHMYGESASEIIQMVSIALKKGVTKKDFDETMALHPTISEEFVTMYN